MNFLLTYGMAVTDRHQGAVALAVLVLCILALSVAP